MIEKQFKDLEVGDTFDWINDAVREKITCFDRFVKNGRRSYKNITTGSIEIMKVGTVEVQVFHVEKGTPQ